MHQGAIILLGQSQDNAVLPSVTISPSDELPFGQWEFTLVPSGSWVDPPAASGFDYVVTSDALITAIQDFPTGFTSPFEVWTGGQMLGKYGPGQQVTFAGGGVKSFSIRGIDPLVDAANTRAFPIKLAYSAAHVNMRITPTPEPGAIGWAVLGIAGLVYLRRQGI